MVTDKTYSVVAELKYRILTLQAGWRMSIVNCSSNKFQVLKDFERFVGYATP